jgi:hypothetical protein
MTNRSTSHRGGPCCIAAGFVADPQWRVSLGACAAVSLRTDLQASLAGCGHDCGCRTHRSASRLLASPQVAGQLALWRSVSWANFANRLRDRRSRLSSPYNARATTPTSTPWERRLSRTSRGRARLRRRRSCCLDTRTGMRRQPRQRQSVGSGRTRPSVQVAAIGLLQRSGGQRVQRETAPPAQQGPPEKGSGLICRNGPKGAAGRKRGQD